MKPFLKPLMREGFSLIEFMVYLISFSCIITMALHSIVVVTQKARSSSASARHSMQLFTALDVIAFEIAQAPSAKNKWYKADPSLCIWHSNFHKKDIGFCLRDKKLLKISGVYSIQTNKWTSKVSNMLAENVDVCSFNYEWLAPEQIKAVACHLSSKACSTTRKISLNNGYSV